MTPKWQEDVAVNLIDQYLIYMRRYTMNFTKTMFALAIGSVGIMGAMSAHAVDLNAGDVLTINTGAVNAYAQSVTGSYFVMALKGDSTVQ